MSYQYQPLSAQQEHNEELETDFLIREIGMTSEQVSNLTKTEQLPSTTTPVEETQMSSEEPDNLSVLENLMSTLPPELKRILATVTQQFPSEFDPNNLSSMMNFLMDDKITESMSDDQADLLKSILENLPNNSLKESEEDSIQND